MVSKRHQVSKFFQRLIVILACLAPLFASTPLSAGKRQPSFKEQYEQVNRLYRIAENAMKAKDFQQASALFAEIMQMPVEEVIDPSGIQNLRVRWATALVSAGRYEKAKPILHALLQQELPSHHYLRCQLLAAEIQFQTGDGQGAYDRLKTVRSHISAVEWSVEDRALLVKVEESLQQHYQNLLVQAEKLFDAALHTESIPLYKKVIQGCEEGFLGGPSSETAIKAQHRLAQILYIEDDFAGVVELLQNRPWEAFERDPALWDLFRNQTYLLGISYRHIEEYDDAIRELQQYLSYGEPDELKYFEEALWEAGLSSFHLGDYSQARRYLQGLSPSTKKPRLFHLAQLYLGRIALIEDKLDLAQGNLKVVAESLAATDPLRYEVAYLRGEVAYRQGKMAQAIEQFEAALPKRNRDKAHWYANALYNLGWSYLHQGKRPELDNAQRHRFFEQSQATFKKLLAYTQREALYLTLAEAYLTHAESLDINEPREELEKLLSGENLFSSLELEAEALLMRAGAARSLTDKEQLLDQLTTKDYSATKAYRKGWYFKGMTALEHAKGAQDSRYLDAAAAALTKAAAMLQPEHPSMSGEASAGLIEIQLIRGSEQDLRQGLWLCDQLVTEQESVWKSMRHPDKVLYLKAMLSSHLDKKGVEGNYAETARRALQRLISAYPKGTYRDDAYHLLGTLAYRQGNYEEALPSFLSLASEHPNSAHAPDAWHWAILCGEKLKQDEETLKSYRRTLFTKYPDSIHAGRAYFQLYRYRDYMIDDSGSLAHLKKMPELYPKHPLTSAAHYLLGLQAARSEGPGVSSDLIRAVESFDEAILTYDSALKSNRIHAGDLAMLTNIRYRALVEKGNAQLAIASEADGAKSQIYFEYCQRSFQQAVAALQDPSGTAELLVEADSHPLLLQEAKFGLVRAYRFKKNDQQLERHLADLFDDFAKHQITTGYFLSKAWYEQALLTMRRGNHELALQFLERARTAADDKYLSTDESLDIVLQESLCYRELENYDEAMKRLSQIVNIDAKTDRRDRAMFLRAELYELQGKPKLAVRQLKATASLDKSPWATKAKDKLEKDYGFE